MIVPINAHRVEARAVPGGRAEPYLVRVAPGDIQPPGPFVLVPARPATLRQRTHAHMVSATYPTLHLPRVCPGVFTPRFPYAPQSSQFAKSSQMYPWERGLERGESGLRRTRGGDQRHGETDGHARHQPSDALAAVRLVTGDSARISGFNHGCTAREDIKDARGELNRTAMLLSGRRLA